MHPELLRIPFTDLTVKSYGTMMVIGFMVAVFIMRRLCRRDALDFMVITNAALYCLIAGVVGARIFFVIHYFEEFRYELWNVFAIWNGGLEFLGGVVLAVTFLVVYLWRNKMPIRRSLDIMAIGLMAGLAFGRIGCLLNGCCFGKPTTLAWAIEFPYGSFAYTSQINTNPARGRIEPHLHIPHGQYCYKPMDSERWYPRALSTLSPEQQKEVTVGQYRCLPVHPSQLYSSLGALTISGCLYLIWNQAMRKRSVNVQAWLAKPGLVVGFMFVFYGIVRYLLELSRDDNPFELAFLTVSQIIGIALVLGGIAVIAGVCMLKCQDGVGANAPIEPD